MPKHENRSPKKALDLAYNADVEGIKIIAVLLQLAMPIPAGVNLLGKI